MTRFGWTILGVMIGFSVGIFGQIRVISLSPASTEIICTLNELPHLVGVSQHCNYPKAVRSKPIVGGFLSPNFETLVQLNPTHIIGIGQPDTQALRKLRQSGVKVTLIDSPETITELTQIIKSVGQALGQSKRADQVIETITYQCRRRTTTRRPRTLVVLWHSPLSVAGPNTFIADVVNRAGGQTVLTQKRMQYPTLSKEYVLRLNPDVIVVTDPAIRTALQHDSILKQLQAIQQNRVILIENEDAFLRPGPRIGDAVESLHRAYKTLNVI